MQLVHRAEAQNSNLFLRASLASISRNFDTYIKSTIQVSGWIEPIVSRLKISIAASPPNRKEVYILVLVHTSPCMQQLTIFNKAALQFYQMIESTILRARVRLNGAPKEKWRTYCTVSTIVWVVGLFATRGRLRIKRQRGKKAG